MIRWDPDDDFPTRRAPRRSMAAKHLSVDNSYQWMDHAACSPDIAPLFEVDHPNWNGGQQVKYALSVCGQCPVVDHCREFVDRTGDEWNVAAASTPAERRVPHGAIAP